MKMQVLKSKIKKIIADKIGVNLGLSYESKFNVEKIRQDFPIVKEDQ